MAQNTSSAAMAASVDTWQADYVAEYRRTTGQAAEFDRVGSGGWVTLTTQHTDGVEHVSRVRKADVMAMTARLRTRPDFTPDEV